MSARGTVAVFGSSRLGPDDPEYAAAVRLGRLLGEAGWTVATGGHDGAMAAVSRGARGAGAHVIGVTLPGADGRRLPNEWVAEERPAASLFARLEMLIDADAWVAVAGGVGTLAEIAVAWNLMQNAHVPSRPLIVVGERWRSVLDVLRAELVVDQDDLAMVKVAPDADATVALLGEWSDRPHSPGSGGGERLAGQRPRSRPYVR